MNTTILLAASLALLLPACAQSGLARLVLDGRDLHPSLETARVGGPSSRLMSPDVQPGNPHLSSDPGFVEAVARYGSQGRVGGEGLRAGLFGVYRGEGELGIYAVEAVTGEEAARLEEILRSIWAHNARLDRARVHRAGTVLVVLFHDGVSPDSWEAANTVVAERLITR